jgi:hypothetical protein
MSLDWTKDVVSRWEAENAELERAADAVRQTVRRDAGPWPQGDLEREAASFNNHRVGEGAVRLALWDMIGSRELTITSDGLLEPTVDRLPK